MSIYSKVYPANFPNGIQSVYNYKRSSGILQTLSGESTSIETSLLMNVEKTINSDGEIIIYSINWLNEIYEGCSTLENNYTKNDFLKQLNNASKGEEISGSFFNDLFDEVYGEIYSSAQTLVNNEAPLYVFDFTPPDFSFSNQRLILCDNKLGGTAIAMVPNNNNNKNSIRISLLKGSSTSSTFSPSTNFFKWLSNTDLPTIPNSNIFGNGFDLFLTNLSNQQKPDNELYPIWEVNKQ